MSRWTYRYDSDGFAYIYDAEFPNGEAAFKSCARIDTTDQAHDLVRYCNAPGALAIRVMELEKALKECILTFRGFRSTRTDRVLQMANALLVRDSSEEATSIMRETRYVVTFKADPKTEFKYEVFALSIQDAAIKACAIRISEGKHTDIVSITADGGHATAALEPTHCLRLTLSSYPR